MAKEFEKFSKTYSDLVGDRKKHTEEVVLKIWAELKQTEILADNGQHNLREAAAQAVRDGTDPKDQGAMMKHPAVHEAIILFGKMAAEFAEDLKRFDTFNEGADSLCKKLEKLEEDIKKDLKSRSKSSESKADIEDLQVSVKKETERVSELLGWPKRVTAYQRDYFQKMPVTVKRLISENMAEYNEKRLEETEVTAELRDRNLAQEYNKAKDLCGQIKDKCDQAEKAGSGQAALPILKEAALALTELTKLAKKYSELKKQNIDALNKAANKDKLLGYLDGIIDLHAKFTHRFNEVVALYKK